MYVITVLFSIKPAHYAEFLKAVISNAKTSLMDEQGCWQFDVCTSSTHPGDVFLYEVYEAKDAFDVHLASEHFLAFNTLTSTWVAAKVVNAFDRTYMDIHDHRTAPT
jgi:(4S)-4-hydroxy-5-phosphonooxypentane-2,3-dione isomerase